MVRKGLNRKGLSDVVVTVLLILLVVAAIAIIWGFISTFLRSTDKIDTNTLNTALSIQAKSVMINWNGTLSFNAKMDSGESVDRVQITLYDNSGNTKMIYRNVSFQKLEVKNFYIPVEEHGFVNIAKIEIVPVIETQTGLQVGTMKGEYNINQVDIKPGCGNNVTDSEEECDSGANNGIVPSNILYGSSVNYCSLECKIVSASGESCGDGILNISAGEECEQGNLNGQACTNKGYSSGTLNCNSCRFNTSLCYLPTSGLKAYWKFDETSGSTAADSSGNGNTLTVSSGSQFKSGKRNNGIRFYGQGNGGADRNNFQINMHNGTISLWVNLSSAANCQDGVCTAINANINGAGTDGNLMMRYQSSSIQFKQMSSTEIDLSYASDTNNWINYVITWNEGAGQFKVYKNGFLNQTASMPSVSDPIGITIGANRPNMRVFNGTIDEVIIWDRTLNSTEIAQIYSAI